jgi:hypothetical protein
MAESTVAEFTMARSATNHHPQRTDTTVKQAPPLFVSCASQAPKKDCP